MLGTSTHLANSKEWVSCLILINLISHLIQSSDLPAGPSPGDGGKPHWATTYTLLDEIPKDCLPIPNAKDKISVKNSRPMVVDMIPKARSN